MEKALIEMYFGGGVGRVEDITEALWAAPRSPATVSNLNKKDLRHNRGLAEPADQRCSSLRLPRRQRVDADHEVTNVSLLVATSVNGERYRESFGIVEGAKEDKASWLNVLKHLKDRGLGGVRLIISDACLGLWRLLVRCTLAKVRGALVPQHVCARAAGKDGGSGFDAQGNPRRARAGGRGHRRAGRSRLEAMKLPKLAEWIAATVGETLSYHALH